MSEIKSVFSFLKRVWFRLNTSMCERCGKYPAFHSVFHHPASGDEQVCCECYPYGKCPMVAQMKEKYAKA